MYGIINKSIEDLVTENYGETVWKEIKEKSGVDIDFFISTDPYDDSITYSLAGAIAEKLEAPLSKILNTFGEWWVLKTCNEKYNHLLQSGGDSFKDFLLNLPNFHNRVMMYYPNLAPPEFKVSDITDNGLHLHYHSHREGLKDFVEGLIHGLAKFFNKENIEVQHLQTVPGDNTHEVFKIQW